MAITASLEPNAVELWFVRAGGWLEPQRFSFEIVEGKPVSLDRKLRDLLASMEGHAEERTHKVRERQEYLALLSRWYYSSWREGEWISVTDLNKPPIRRLVGAVSRVAGIVSQSK